MNIHEYQAKQILKRYQVRVNEGRLVEEGPDLELRAEKAALELQSIGQGVLVVKGQIHAGGRGKLAELKFVKM
jgi:succinyl-CoA synthetase beta subunit